MGSAKKAFPTWISAKIHLLIYLQEDRPHILHINENLFKTLLETETKQLCEETAE